MYDIYLSIQNRTEEIRIPVIPPSFGVVSEYANERIETITHDEIMHLGNKRLSTISFASFFPVTDDTYLRSRDIFGWEYVNMINRWREKKIPIRLIITDTNINMPITITSFEYRVQDGTGDIYYSLMMEEYKFVDLQKLKSVPIEKPKPVIEEPKPVVGGGGKKSPTSGKYSKSKNTKVTTNVDRYATTTNTKSKQKGGRNLKDFVAFQQQQAKDKLSGDSKKAADLQAQILKEKYDREIAEMTKKANDEQAERYNLTAEEQKRYDEFDSRGAFYPTWAN